MNLVGYDMYCLLLEQAVAELKGQQTVEKVDTNIDIGVSAFIPSKSVEDEKQRIEMYRKIAAISTEEDIQDVEDEYIDRYGDVPESVDNLMQIAHMKHIAGGMCISEITYKDSMIVFAFERIVSTKSIVEIISDFKGKMMFSSGNVSYLSYKCENDVIKNIKIILQKLQNAIQQDEV